MTRDRITPNTSVRNSNGTFFYKNLEQVTQLIELGYQYVLLKSDCQIEAFLLKLDKILKQLEIVRKTDMLLQDLGGLHLFACYTGEELRQRPRLYAAMSSFIAFKLEKVVDVFRSQGNFENQAVFEEIVDFFETLFLGIPNLRVTGKMEEVQQLIRELKSFYQAVPVGQSR